MHHEELWEEIPGFSNYLISSLGQIFNRRTGNVMVPSQNNHGHTKISLVTDKGTRHTKSVALLVAEAFVEKPNLFCDQVVILNGDLTHVASYNLVWRPRWFAWKYSTQLKSYPPQHYSSARVKNINSGVNYPDILTAAQTEGLLYDDIWRSTYSGSAVYPYNHRFEIVT